MSKNIPIFNDIEQINKLSTLLLNEPITIELMQTLTSNCYARNSLLSFKNDLIHFREFCLLNNRMALPSSAETVITFLHHFSQDKKYASIKRCGVTISLVHKTLSLKDPMSTSQVQLLLRKLRIEKQGDSKQAEPFRQQHLYKLIQKLSLSDHLKDIRDIAIWSLMLENLLKRSELTALTIDRLYIDNKNEQVYLQLIDNEFLPLSSDTQTALSHWISAANIDSGFLFRRIDKHQNIGSNPMDHSSIYRVFRRASELLGIKKHFSGQSPRVGAVKDLSDQGVKLNEIQTLGRWRSNAMPAQYIGLYHQQQQQFAKFRKKQQLSD
ncbi:tyrosine-type recombinase/integrase [Vibrio sp. SS-MA-C1-2]|uniref:tyrosine-type recombinase/integrase n=1 Tax=Vibrio sp. SS-MA-C1-2 TaxID=2908646 RepID=UPI001F350382|nr:tyrosine-type recombinase/integrase [Vibrio sp. SS-MA-C1-2]UJF17298.1 tyrosine-type recombinase/integrase [Vibrio sp. SS-MA-C1-2]